MQKFRNATRFYLDVMVDFEDKFILVLLNKDRRLIEYRRLDHKEVLEYVSTLIENYDGSKVTDSGCELVWRYEVDELEIEYKIYKDGKCSANINSDTGVGIEIKKEPVSDIGCALDNMIEAALITKYCDSVLPEGFSLPDFLEHMDEYMEGMEDMEGLEGFEGFEDLGDIGDIDGFGDLGDFGDFRDIG